MASDKKLSIELEMNDDAELGTAVIFFQKLVIVMAKFGLTYFKSVTLRQDWKTLLQFETTNVMTSAIKEFHEEQLAKREALSKARQEAQREIPESEIN